MSLASWKAGEGPPETEGSHWPGRQDLAGLEVGQQQIICRLYSEHE